MKSISQLSDMHGRKVLITGACGALGAVFAETISELGGDLFLVDRPEADFAPLIEKLNFFDNEIICVHCDLESEVDRKELIKKIKSFNVPLSVLVNNAAFGGTSELEGWITKFEDQNLDSWRRAIEVNLTAPFDLAKELSPLLKKSGNGSIINIASIYGINGPNLSLYEDTLMGNPAAYAASKGGLIQFTRWLSTVLAPEVRVNSICPGGILRNQPEIFIKRYNQKTPLNRMGTEEDFKGVIAYLASDLSSYVTGENIVVDGGFTTW
jgi:NAD(P)-dependent dehydrogenase (short-subunit alcohol dehydrogenase family)